LRRPFIIALLLLAGCSQILGLEDRKLILDGGLDGGQDGGQDGGNDSGVSADCAEYCDLADTLCTADAGVQLFQEKATCRAVCSKYSTDPSTSGNTLACRLFLLRSLANTGTGEATTTCQGAGPGGGPPPNEPNGASCGTDCEGFCTLREKVCPQMAGDVGCADKCKALKNDTLFNAESDFGTGQDTLSCRIAHLSAATLYDVTEAPNAQGIKKTRDAHCSHSGIRSEMQCDFPEKVPIDCSSYCKLVGTACTGDNAVYTSTAECEAFCKELESGSPADTTKPGTARCLRDKAYSALESGPTFCPAAGPPGDLCDGGRCASYCLLAAKEKGCAVQFASKYPNGATQCQQECLGLPGASGKYSVTQGESNGGANMQCRIKRLTRVLGKTSISPADDCAAALGLPGSACN
jgi:hypothetical protein